MKVSTKAAGDERGLSITTPSSTDAPLASQLRIKERELEAGGAELEAPRRVALDMIDAMNLQAGLTTLARMPHGCQALGSRGFATA